VKLIKLQPGQRWRYSYGPEDYICEVQSVVDTAVEVIIVQNFKDDTNVVGHKYVFWTAEPGDMPEDCGTYRYLQQQDKPK
jgi:hypothetical protein